MSEKYMSHLVEPLYGISQHVIIRVLGPIVGPIQVVCILAAYLLVTLSFLFCPPPTWFYVYLLHGRISSTLVPGLQWCC